MSPNAANPDFEKVYQRLAPVVLAFLKSKCFGAVDANDVAQDVWKNAFRGWNRFDGANPKAWMFTIARNCLTDSIRRTGRDQSTSLESDVAVAESEISEEVEALRHCLDTVDGEFVVVLRARVLDGRSVKNRLGISE
jgi:RNA polymerase sigma factor (sigma-70 family)